MPQYPMSDNPYRLVSAGDGPCLLINRDLTNQVLIGPDSGIQGGNPNSVSVIDPLGSTAVDGKDDVYGIRVPGASTRPNVDVQVGASYWAPSPAQVAAQINALGLATAANQASQLATAVNGTQITGFVANPVSLYNIVAQVITAGSVQQLVPVNPSPIAGFATVNELGYELAITTRNHLGSGTNSFTRVDVSFYDNDSLTAVPIDVMTWWLPVADSLAPGPCIIQGKGPLRGVYMSVVVTNPSPGFANAGSIDFTMLLNGLGRSYARDIWSEQPSYQTLGGGNSIRPGGQGQGSNALFNIGTQSSPVSLANGANTQRLLPLYSGKLTIKFNFVSGAGTVGSIGFHFYPQNALGNAGAIGSNPLQEVFIGGAAANPAIATAELWFPNDLVNCNITNTTGAVATFSALAVVEQY